jgi:hypothetical protein
MLLRPLLLSTLSPHTHLHGGTAPSCEAKERYGGHAGRMRMQTRNAYIKLLSPFLTLTTLTLTIPIFTAARRHLGRV